MEFTIHGGLSPYLDVELAERERVIAESGSLVVKEPSVRMTSQLSGGFAGALKRVVAGTSLFVVEYEGPGQVTLTHGRTGRIVPLELDGAREVHVASRAFLCCEDTVSVDVAVPKDGASLLWAQLPLFMLRFAGKGRAFAFARGDLKEIELGRGERVDVAPGRIVYLDRSVKVRRTQSTSFFDAVLGGAGPSLATLTGPGTVCLQTRDEEEYKTVVVNAGNSKKERRRRPRPPGWRPDPERGDDEREPWIWGDHRGD
jgi:uncharacterized protein (AIM24 family)